MSVQDHDLAPGQAEDDARPDAAATDAQQGGDGAAGTRTTDPDALELAAALAAAQAEEAGTPAAPEPQQPTAITTAPAEQPTQPQQVVPASVVAAMRRELRQQREQNAYLQGALEVVQRRGGDQPQDPQQQSPQQPAPAASIKDQIAAHRAELERLAGEFDAGNLVMREYEAQRGRIDDAIADLRIAQMAPPPAPEGIVEQAYETAHLNRLLEAHPYAHGLSTDQAIALADAARTELALEGTPVGTGKAETLRLRERVALLSDRYGPRWGIAPRQAAAPQQPNRQQAPNAAPHLSPAAQARVAKMDLRSQLPPDPSGMGHAAQGEMTESQILTMSDEDIAALPPAVQARLLQSTG